MATRLQRQSGQLMQPSAVVDARGPAVAARLLQPFVDHPASVGETYRQHLRFAAGFGASMLGGGVACLIHALCPFLFQTTGSRTVRRLHQQLVHCRRLMPAAPPDGGATVASKQGAPCI